MTEIISSYSTSRLSRIYAAAIAIAIAATSSCSKEKDKSPEAPKASQTILEPFYSVEHVRNSVITQHDLGKKWSKGPLPEAFSEGELRSCSGAKIKIPKEPPVIADKFGEPKFQTTGANYARLVAVYDTSTDALSAMTTIRKKVAGCPEEKEFPSKKLPNGKVTVSHLDKWSSSEETLDGWNHIRAVETVTYPTWVSIVNVRHLIIDFAQRGNVVFSSMYVQRLRPNKSSKELEEKAVELLEGQLGRFG